MIPGGVAAYDMPGGIMKGWHYASADLRILHYFNRGVALCNLQWVPGKRVDVELPENACRKCLCKLDPGWKRTRRGGFNHFFEYGYPACKHPLIRASGDASPSKQHCSRCSERMMRRIDIRSVRGPQTCRPGSRAV